MGGHNLLLIEKIKDKDIRKIYAENTIKNGWSRKVLAIQIETEFHKRIGNSNNNFNAMLPPKDSDLVNNTIKDPYIFDFITLKEEYKNASGTCYMDPRDMGKLGVKNWDTVLVKTEWGEVVVNAAVSRDAPHEGTVFICKGPWANTVVSPDTYCCSDPTYKGIHCTVEKTDREVLLMADLMRLVYKKYVDSDDDDVVEHMESLGERPVYKGRKWEELIDHDI